MRKPDGVETALAAALRPGTVDDASAQAAVAAFREARDTGLHRSRRTRRREDWRPVPERGMGRSLKTTLAALAASLTLGGVAFAAAASYDPVDETETREPEPRRSTSAPLPSRGPEIPSFESPGSSSPALAGSPDTPGNPAEPGRSSEALCRAYEKVLDKGKAMEAAAWERLVAAADGKDVGTYCDSLPASTAAGPPPAFGNGHSAPAKGPADTHAKPDAGDSVHHSRAPVGDAAGDRRGR
ncbi:hypothetical protein ACFVFI_13440 [Streptomyces sp. NPDC057705]|uniref:hypothetical protein n=1 Tax=Streptomyces sp. NPDC057705 TaxID=3346222 RepID=UPI0036C0C67C